MYMTDIITHKKEHMELTEAEIAFFVEGAAKGSVPDYQLAALLMAIRLNGMTSRETARLTLAMAHSGDIADLSAIPGVCVDKHSTGGVGDTTTLVLAPLVAACGVPVAKMSGRGLGHTGGTIDKLEAIPGLRVELTEEAFISQVKRIGCAITGQSRNMAPADKTLYALRDVTSTVDSLPLIASSIMSKKLASGAGAIVLDVKTGSGAIMHDLEGSIQLAKTMVEIGRMAGLNTAALVTGMEEPLGTHVGNALEVKEAIDVLSGRTKGALLEVSLLLGSHMVTAAGRAENPAQARALLTQALETGRGLKKLEELICAQGGDGRVCHDVSLLPQAKVRREALCVESGWLKGMDTQQLGLTAQRMGAGRKTKQDSIDYSVGFVIHKRIGDQARKGEPVCTIYADGEESALRAEKEILDNLRFSKKPVPPAALCYAVVTCQGVTRMA